MAERNDVLQQEQEYDGSQIQVLEGLEAVRKRPGMYIGSTGPRGLHHLVYEIVDNAIDEALAGFCDHIEVTIKDGNVMEVVDNGRGIPVGVQPKIGIAAVTVVFTMLHAGGKFGGDNSGYKVSGGLHGVGASVVNALSEWLTVEVHTEGKTHYQKFLRGQEEAPLAVTGDTSLRGTTVRWKADDDIFEEVNYDYETLLTRLREQAFLNAGVRITLTDERPGQEKSESLLYEGGIRQFVEHIHTRRGVGLLHEDVVYFRADEGDASAEVALQYNDSYNELLLSFANNIHTPDGGTHEQGFKTGLTRAFNDFGREKGYIKEKDENLQGNDVREGMTAIISVKLCDAQFEGQTKAKLGNTEMRGIVESMVYQKLDSTTIFTGKIVRLTVDTALLENGKTATREVVHHGGGAGVVALNEKGEVALIRQYRYAVGRELVELPAGKIEAGEAPIATARRELAEEA
ncbi:NUDIX domain-containing protein, partial [Ruminococcaceae bacterium OttesenSCG-928-O06]|nr:NUDIX domain-containing protein [Ruminococcaceae bacterium OttesenSCG-928-O06]